MEKAEAAKAPVIMEAKLINENMIELDWQGFDYIKGAGASKENTSADNSTNFEIQLTQNGTTITLAQDSPYLVLTLQNDETKSGTHIILGTASSASASWRIEKEDSDFFA